MGTPSRSAGSSLQYELATTCLSLLKQQQHHGLRSEGHPRRLRLHRQGASHHGPCWILQGLLSDVGRRAGSDRDAYRLVENPARPARPCWRLGAVLAVTLFSNVGWRMLGHALGHERCLEPPDNATATASFYLFRAAGAAPAGCAPGCCSPPDHQGHQRREPGCRRCVDTGVGS